MMFLSKYVMNIALVAALFVTGTSVAQEFKVCNELQTMSAAITKEPAKLADFAKALENDATWKAFKALSYEEQIKSIVQEIMVQPNFDKNIVAANFEQFSNEYATMFAEMADSISFTYSNLEKILASMKAEDLKGKSEEDVITALSMAAGEIVQAQFTRAGDKAAQEKMMNALQEKHEKAIAVAKEILTALFPKKEAKKEVKAEAKPEAKADVKTEVKPSTKKN